MCLGRERCFFHVSAIEVGAKCCSSHLQPREGKILGKFGNRFSSSRGVQGVRRRDHVGLDTRLSYSWPVEHLLSVLHSFKVKYVLQGKYITLDLGSFPPNTLCLVWRCLCQWWISQCKYECVVQLEAYLQEQCWLSHPGNLIHVQMQTLCWSPDLVRLLKTHLSFPKRGGKNYVSGMQQDTCPFLQ